MLFWIKFYFIYLDIYSSMQNRFGSNR